jgi:phosphatidylinositol alpha-1,6-mannosyltransferase
VTSTGTIKHSPKVLALVSDAFGGHGGIALYMRDVLRCIASMDSGPEITLIARAGEPEGAQVPANVHWAKDGLNGKWAFATAVLAASVKGEKPDLIICGHINLLPLAKLAALLCSSPVVLFIYGIDAWKPPKSMLARKLANSASLIISISEITRQRFLS